MPLLRSTLLLLISLAFVATEAIAQQPNLLPQPSFEAYITCPNGLSDIPEAYWDKAPFHTGSSDYFNACATVTACDVPNNTFGSSLAATGDAYAGGYIGLTSGTYREYIFDTLSQVLVAGQQYEISFKYKKASNTSRAGDDMGFYLSATPPTGTGTGALGVTPQSQNPSGNYLTNSNWATYADTIIATGGEQYITIGAFNAFPSTIANGSGSIGGAYMYWDDVDVHLLQGIAGDTFVCIGDTAQIYSIELDSVQWFEQGSSVLIDTVDTIYVAPTQTTTYLCITPNDTLEWTVEVIEPMFGFLGNDTIICEGQTVTKTLNFPGYTYDWSDGSSDSTFSTQDSGDHSVTVTFAGCESSDTFNIDVFFFPEYDLGPDTAICSYDEITLDPNVTGGVVSYTWNTGNTTSSITVSNPGTYWVDMTNSNCTMRDTLVLTHHPDVAVDLGPDMEFCYSDAENILPIAQNASNFTWSTGSSATQITVTQTGTYFVTAEGNGCVASDSVTYTFFYDPYFEFPETLMYCSDDTITLSSGLTPSAHTFLWNVGTTNPTLDISGGSQGDYWLQVTDGNCTMRDTVYVGMYVPIDLELGPDIQSCEGRTETITPNSNSTFSYDWSTGANTFSLTVNQTGVYGLTVSDGNCTETDKIRVFFNEYPTVDLGEDTILCEEAELRYNIEQPWQGVEYYWYDGTTTPDHYMYADESQTIWVRAKNVVCSTVDSLRITLHTPPVIELIDDTIICTERTAQVKAEGNSNWSYVWSSGDSTQSMTTSVPGEFFVTVDDGICQTIENVMVYEYLDLVADIFGPEVICLGDVEVLDASVEGANYYKWNDGSDLPTLSIIESGTYSVDVYHDCGVASDSIVVEDCECFVRFPTAFRPSPSGVNKTFGAVFDCEITDFKLTIVDRWGEVVFYSEDPIEHWDGKFKSELVQTGAYAWICEYKGISNEVRVTRKEQGAVMVLK